MSLNPDQTPRQRHVQDFRDVSRQEGFPDEIDWPVNPLEGL